ncbi:hypothetical protein CEXT_222071 [Caerostris extrusa]|uniref:Uncharacterized protein n=1 Tax=Caerostris extrusa TaxID=172846 RepID=A0AAV4VUZ1_CAEEX|nr:hypothetical protein CEXT_222071 [Caerostris extrusa]
MAIVGFHGWYTPQLLSLTDNILRKYADQSRALFDEGYVFRFLIGLCKKCHRKGKKVYTRSEEKNALIAKVFILSEAMEVISENRKSE